MRKHIFSTLTLVFFIAGFFWYLSSNWSSFQQISLSTPYLLVPAVVFTLVNIYSIGSLVETAIEPHGIKLSRSEIFGLSSLTRFSNHISPGYLGAALRAVYLKKTYKVSYAKFTSSFALSNILQFIISGIMALAVYVLYVGTLTGPRPLFVIFGAIVFFVLLLFMPLTKPVTLMENMSKRHSSKLLERVSATMKEFHKVRSSTKLLYRMFFWMIVSLASSSVTMLALYYSLGSEVGVMPAIFIAALGGWGIIFSITPANIGVREGLMVLGAGIMSVSIPTTLAVAILLRLLTFVVVGILSVYYAPKLLNTTLARIKRYRT